jgi:hypothetical protein
MNERRILQRNRGLSTLDVVMMVVIVVVVAAVLFPVLAPRDHGCHKTKCSNNLHECAIALQTYWTDYDSTLPSSMLVRHSKTWNKADFTRFATRLGQVPVPTNTPPKTWPQALYSHMRSRDVVFCPSDPATRDDPRGRVSYYWKLAIDRAWYGVGCSKPCRKETDFVYNADQIILYERAGFHEGHLEGLRNGTRINVVFLDTHVRNVSLVNCPKGLVTDPCSLGEPMYFNYDQNSVKGPGNPPPPNVLANHTAPSRYSDMLP